MRPYSPLELAGRNIYIREGCYVCHSQMIRPFRDEVERYGHYSLAAESMYDHPFQWGSKRTGPDLARVGDRYSNEWHVQHLIDPRSRRAGIDHAELRASSRTRRSRSKTSSTHLVANVGVGVPYTDEMIANAEADLRAQADPDADTSACCRPAIPRPRSAISTAIRKRSPRWMRSSPICRCSARWSISRPMTKPPVTAEEAAMDYQTMRTFADSWGLLAMTLISVVLERDAGGFIGLLPCRPGGTQKRPRRRRTAPWQAAPSCRRSARMAV